MSALHGCLRVCLHCCCKGTCGIGLFEGSACQFEAPLRAVTWSHSPPVCSGRAQLLSCCLLPCLLPCPALLAASCRCWISDAAGLDLTVVACPSRTLQVHQV